MKSFVAFALLSTAFASPVQKRAAYTDADILNYALTLEHLENKFYGEGLAKFSEQDFSDAGYGYWVYENLKEISYDESTHVNFLTSALTAAGAVPVAECTYNFPLDSVDVFLATASVLEGVGVTAYLGAAAEITTGAYLTAAGSILTVEARHNAYLRSKTKSAPFPQSFDVPLDFNEVYTLAAPFIVSCPASNPTFLPLAAFPALSVVTEGKIYTGSSITVQSADTSITDVPFAAFVTVTGPVWADIEQWGAPGGFNVVVPPGIHGQSYLILTSSKDNVTDSTTVSGPAIVPISNTDGYP